MNAKAETLVPADQLARESPIRIPNESVEYRAARQALLAQEFELRRQIERVAAMRRAPLRAGQAYEVWLMGPSGGRPSPPPGIPR